jgi:ubiquitin carboxyl-terminal hydrolase MINDY-1/2
LIDLEEPESPAWDEDDGSTSDHELPAESGKEHQQLLADQHAWDETREQELHVVEIDTNKFLASEVHAPHFGPERWNLIDHESTTEGQESGVVGEDGAVLSETEDEPTKLPSQISQEQPGHATIPSTSTNAPLVVSPAAAEAAQNQKKETYEIKKISWHDVNSDKNPRTSPILVQNANGPCPLLALVNALTLSTPANVETALVDTLRSREQVSLGLLLDAVLDELMSGRRGDAAQELPDVSDLYYFLITLHTGMNVNPRFFPAPPSKSASDPRNSMSHVHPAEREEAIPGTFEDTREMKLYSTFSVPLIHGWLPAQGSPEYIALKRSATSYEDAQNLMFHEEVLEEKLRRDGLSFEEQATLEDISTIKAFFHSAATQLTAYGLETITVSLAPGAVAILFRNDHFSTLYRHPDTLQLLQLVTDMGYAGHEEVVWESLTDVNGENAEFFSGDFRLVGGAPGSPTQSYSRHASQSNTQWTSAENSSQSQSQSFRAPSPPHRSSQAPQSPTTEQEDHDLALALQLQEEEEERHRDEIDRRRRETELSQQYIEQQGSQPNSIPVTNQRRGGGGHRGPRPPPRPEPRPNLPRRPPSPETRPIVPPRTEGPGGQPIGGQPIDPEAGVDAPPPSYEQAATQAAYVPPADHPSHPNSDPSARRRASAFDGNSQAASPGADTYRNAAAVRRRAVTSQGTPQKQQQDKDCIVM